MLKRSSYEFKQIQILVFALYFRLYYIICQSCHRLLMEEDLERNSPVRLQPQCSKYLAMNSLRRLMPLLALCSLDVHEIFDDGSAVEAGRVYQQCLLVATLTHHNPSIHYRAVACWWTSAKGPGPRLRGAPRGWSLAIRRGVIHEFWSLRSTMFQCSLLQLFVHYLLFHLTGQAFDWNPTSMIRARNAVSSYSERLIFEDNLRFVCLRIWLRFVFLGRRRIRSGRDCWSRALAWDVLKDFVQDRVCATLFKLLIN